MRMPLLAALFACVIPIVSLAHEPVLTSADRSRIEAEVRETVDQYVEIEISGLHG